MVKYDDMLRDGVWYNSNLYLEDGRLYANLSGTRWIVLARNDDIIRMSKDKVSTNPEYFSKMFETLHDMDIRKESSIL